MRRFLPLLCLSVLPLSAQSTFVSLIRQPHATLVEFTTPVTEIELKDPGSLSRIHLGIGLGLRHWDDGSNAIRFLVDTNVTAGELFMGLGAIAEAPSGEGVYAGIRLRGGWVFHPNWIVSLEGEHMEKPFADGLKPKRNSSLGLVLTARF